MAVAAVGAVAFVVLSVLLVPFDPIPGGPLHPPPPSSVFTAEEIRRAEDFASWARLWGWSSLAVSTIVASLLGFTRAGERLVGRLPGPWWVQAALAVTVLALIGRVVTLPFAVLLRRHARDYGLSNQAWGAFAVDLVKSEALGIVIASVVVLVLVGSARRWSRAWPVVAGSVLAGLVLMGSFVYPLVVEPLFNNFTSLPEGSLRTQVLELAEAEDVEVDDVLVADASRRTTTLNAYVSGIGSSRRVVVYDTLIEGVPEGQVLSVVAHELAHARHQDVVTGALLGASGMLVGVGLLGLIMGPGTGRRLTLDDPRSVPRVLALVAVTALLVSPLQNGISRKIETRADVEALRATGDPETFTEMQTELARRSLADPTPPAWSHFWFGSHPTTLMRIALAQSARASS